MTEDRPPLPGTRSVLALLQVAGGDGPAQAATAAERLRRLYAPVLPGCAVQLRWHAPTRSALLAVGAPAPLPDTGWWGVPAGAGPHPAGGPWVRWEVSAHAVVLTTSANTVTTLRRARGPGGTAWATRSLAAQVLVGSRPSVRRDVVPEYVLLDCTIGDADLLDGITRLPDATTLTVSPDGIRQGVRAGDERWAPGAPTTAAGLRQAALDAADSLGEVPGAALGLTAGRDSGLLAAALVATGRRPPAFTMGWRGLPDVDGAARRASELGLPHAVVALEDLRGDVLNSSAAVAASLRRPLPAGELVAAVMLRTRWSDGNEVPRNVLLGGLHWGGEPFVWLTGSGGELARALYWHDSVPQDDPLTAFLQPRTTALARPALAHVRERVGAELAAARELGRPGRSGLDLLYLRSRMRNWLGNVGPLSAFTGVLPGLLEPPTVRALLDVPEEERRTGRLFDRVVADLLAEVGGGGARPAPPAPAVGRLRRLLHRGDPLSDWQLLDRLLTRLDRHGPGVAREVMGDAWWAQARRHAPSRPYARQWLWNAVAVDALALTAEQL